MNHYVCSGFCGGEAVLPGVCEVSDCARSGKPLVQCKCEDGKHEAMNHFRNEPNLSDGAPTGPSI